MTNDFSIEDVWNAYTKLNNLLGVNVNNLVFSTNDNTCNTLEDMLHNLEIVRLAIVKLQKMQITVKSVTSALEKEIKQPNKFWLFFLIFS